MAAGVTVKVCGLTRPVDVAAALAAGADFFGMILYPKSPRQVVSEGLGPLLGAVPAGRRVMVDVSPTPGDLADRRTAGFDFFQVHFDPGRVGEEELRAWSDAAGRERLWLAPRLPPGEPFPGRLLDWADTFVLDTFAPGAFGGTGKTGDWAGFRRLREIHPDRRWVLAGGLGPENVAAAIEATGATAVDLNSGVESAPGIKDPGRVQAAVRAARGP